MSGPSGAVRDGETNPVPSSPHGNPYDINGTNFIPEKFINKIISDYSLNKLIETESSLIRQIQDLDSDMQTLVYENYNKFILATDTIRKMKTDFKEMEDRMGLLSKNIALITDNSAKVCSSLKEKRDRVSRLSGINDLLKKLKYLFELPNNLKTYFENGYYEQAVNGYLDGVSFIDEFKNFPSLEAIKVDCKDIVKKIIEDLYMDFDDEDKSPQDLTRNVALLLSLGESSDVLGQRLLDNAKPKLTQNLDSMKTLALQTVPLEEFMEHACGVFLSNFSLVIASFSQVFLQTADVDEQTHFASHTMLRKFTIDMLSSFMTIVEIRLTCTEEIENIQATDQRDEFLKALDRLFRKLVAMSTLMPSVQFSPCAVETAIRAAKLDTTWNLKWIKSSFEKAVKDASAELTSQPGSSQEILGSILATLVLKTKSSMTKLQEFLRGDLQFAQSAEFRFQIFLLARDGLCATVFRHLAEFGRNLFQDEQYSNLTWLLLAKLYLDIEIGTVEYMVNSVETNFDIRRDKLPRSKLELLTNVSSLASELKETAKGLVKEFVSCQGNYISEIMKSAVLRNDLMSITRDPIGPSQQMKQVIEVLTTLEKQVDSIFPDSDSSNFMKSERSSDSSRRSLSTLGGRGPARPSIWSGYNPNMATNIQKLFSEKVEIFGNVELHKSDIMMAVVKIGLRALLECLRQKTLCKFGLRQIQVDVLYLQMYLWRFVNNESYLYSLLDEILASSIQRCVNPSLLEAGIVESLAEK